MSSFIRYLQRNEIDDQKWNSCVNDASNGLIYAYTYYLDRMAKNWSALVLADYEYVMPLTWNSKWGFYYLYQPAFTASLGVFGKNTRLGRTEEFIKAIPKKYKLIEIDLNSANYMAGAMERSNYTLSLKNSYTEIYNGFRESTQRNIKKAIQLNCRYEKNIDINHIIALSKEQSKTYSNISDLDYENFKSLFELLEKEDRAITTGVYGPDNSLAASCVYFFSHGRAYYILVGNHPNGKTIGASHYLIDRFINEHAGKELILDFEGSDIRNLAFFYSSFGASMERYPALRINRLPWWARLFK